MRDPVGGLSRRSGLTGAAVAAVGALLACGGSGGSAQDGATEAAGTTPAPSVASVRAPAAARPAAGACPHDGRWRLCSVVDRLDKAGLVPRVDSSAPPERLPFLHAPGRVIRLGVGELHTFVYDDTAALARDVAALDTTRAAPRGQTYAWAATPTFVRSANLVAVLLTPNDRQIERIQLALDAGPPQPGRSP